MQNKPQPLLAFRRDRLSEQSDREPIWTPQIAPSPPPASVSLPGSVEEELVTILTMAIPSGMSAVTAFQHKEAAVFDVLAQLDPAQALQLRMRLRAPRGDDDLAQAFQRFTADRRQRVMAFLADTKRRTALAAAIEGGVICPPA